jgi:nucleoporin GLE1
VGEEKRKAEARRKMAEEMKRRIIEEEERREKEEAEAERLKAERSQAEEQGRNLLGLTTSEEDWANAHNTLLVRYELSSILASYAILV